MKKVESALTEEQAITLYETGWWEEKTSQEIVAFQLYERRLCMPFDIFHKAIEQVFGRPVFTHEFACAERLQAEHGAKCQTVTLEDILKPIPEEKRFLILLGEEK